MEKKPAKNIFDENVDMWHQPLEIKITPSKTADKEVNPLDYQKPKIKTIEP